MKASDLVYPPQISFLRLNVVSVSAREQMTFRFARTEYKRHPRKDLNVCLFRQARGVELASIIKGPSNTHSHFLPHRQQFALGKANRVG